MSYQIFDIETGPLPEDQLARIKPDFKAPSNYKDPVKIAQNIAIQHQEWISDAALSAQTGQILCIGMSDGIDYQVLEGTEEELLERFWLEWRFVKIPERVFVGHNIKGFDLQFLVQRTFIHGLYCPSDVIEGNRWNKRFLDTMEWWGCRAHQSFISLDQLSKVLGFGPKIGTGADFHKLWALDRPKAVEYVLDDLKRTKNCAAKMGMLPRTEPSAG